MIQYVQWSSVTLSKRPLMCSILKLFSDMVHLAILGATAPLSWALVERDVTHRPSCEYSYEAGEAKDTKGKACG